MRVCSSCWKISKGRTGSCQHCGSLYCFDKKQYPPENNAEYLSQLTPQLIKDLSLKLGKSLKHTDNLVRQFKVLILTEKP